MRFNRLFAIFVVPAALLFVPERANSDIIWNFSKGHGGWTVVDLQCGGMYHQPIYYYEVNWHTSGGFSGGFISREDPSGNCFFFEAPTESLGDWSSYLFGRLTFAMQSTENSWSQDNVIALAGEDGTVLVAELEPLPSFPPKWTHYSIPLRAEYFRHQTKHGSFASAADLRYVLSRLAALRIGGEFGAVVSEITGLDEVMVLQRLPGDINGDDCIDDADLLAVLFAIGIAGDELPEDLNFDGTVNDTDLLMVLQHFGEGC